VKLGLSPQRFLRFSKKATMKLQEWIGQRLVGDAAEGEMPRHVEAAYKAAG
jgi:hypothetical protein